MMPKRRRDVIVSALLPLILAVPLGLALASTGSAATRELAPNINATKNHPYASKRVAGRLARVAGVRTLRSPKEASLTVGLSLADQLSSGTGSSLSGWDARAQSENTQLVRLDVNWSSVAPTQPADPTDPGSSGYQWTAVDQAVKDLADAGFAVMITVQSAPPWAEGASRPAAAQQGSWEPNAAALGQFGTAIATRYDGGFPDPASPGAALPRVTDWQPWNEPNLPLYLSPSWVQTDSGWTDEAALIYRGMLNSFYDAVKAVSSSNYVIAAGTAPYGDPAGDLTRVPPVTFDQDLFCLNSQNDPTGNCADPAEFNALDHHPYVSGQAAEGPTWHAALPGDVSMADIYKLTTVLHAAEQAGTVMPTGVKPVWTTEVAWQTSPPQASSAGVPVAEEGLWAEQALYVLWSQGVNTVLWFEIGDPPVGPDTYTDGLYYNNGAAKPAAQGFRFPFITNRRTKSLVEAWGRSPKAGILFVQQLLRGRWTSILKLKVTAGQVVKVPIELRGASRFRAVVGGSYSLTWPQSA